MKLITLKNVRSFLSAHKNIALEKFDKFPEHKQEQVQYRASLCGDCIERGECMSNCGCPTHKVLMSDESCELNRWPDMLDAVEWEAYKATDVFGVSSTD